MTWCTRVRALPGVAGSTPRHNAWRARRGAGRRPKLSTAQLTKVEKALAQGAEADGYVTDLWTLPPVAEVIKRLTGVAYHPGYVWYILRNQLRWSWQRPARRAVERVSARRAHSRYSRTTSSRVHSRMPLYVTPRPVSPMDL